MWYVTHQYHYEDKMFTNAELKEKYNIDGDSVSLSYYSDMKLFEKYDVKEEQYSDKSKFIASENPYFIEIFVFISSNNVYSVNITI